ncbi:hypothetical protein GCM10010967_59140 [Dyadobacter beijingensis]|uniref:Uncharacterized protein n=1 Tax=Dyadobacter beijingensis TaxID=365489 RepID=A0ABQ2IJX7_9BACT|nr:hypothetical protein [Dyadobacter beijingensis]GGN14811.1 hypothetical protein GCM10010967_59140 [Dyadobacter beijingensis]
MKTLRIFIVLILISLQASATGYVHNMFVAHRKLQSGKECVTEKAVARKAKPALKAVKAPVQAKHAGLIKNTSAGTPSIVTLNARILEEGPAALFESEENESSEDSMVSKLVGVVRCVIYTFIPRLGHS